MIGGTLKIFGILLTVLGALVVLAGLGAAGYGYIAEEDNQDRLVADPDESEVNEALMQYGLLGAGVAFVALVVGIVLTVVGGSISRRATPN